ncbi:MAG: heme lyase CcmF/NrfE family subunit [Gammaproteobacteria bacterium]|nr:heme lyase CcmF/NrfE family subunit [Gammaproteobacteria bacterium]MYH34398.1 heme lyase CcmF/NrfE family subunit [Gammaproteobacteria bacterium]MYL01590.1 heme lyase CcmF/NrfE family subunit [Gammaproteobacteria bacterium]
MIPEIGQISLALALCLAVALVVFPLAGAHTGNVRWMEVARPCALGMLAFVALAFAMLAVSFFRHDFSVLYVAQHSNLKLPAMYRFAAIWGAHEGSLVLWQLILSSWTVAVALASRTLPQVLRARVLGVLGLVSIGFLLFILLTSNPFLRLFPAAADGADLNPLLQDPAMAIHPPLLYMGYVGMAVPFAFAIAALLSGRLDRRWARWTRPWTTAAWMFLTVGIALGSWWAYYELGWGGWWFWDPVENASFMPWLAGTALIHTLAVTERRGLFGNTTLLLAIAAFGLSLLGTFLVRSGVLVSVHAFASDPARGLFILVFLAVVMGGALLLYALRNAATNPQTGFRLVSRESALLVNTILLSAATVLVLFGTLYPLALDALDLGKISVGPPYFNLVFILPMLPLLLVVGAGMHASWKATDTAAWGRKLRAPAAIAILTVIILTVAAYGFAGVLTGIGILIAAWVIASALRDPVAWLLRRGPKPRRSTWGMQVAHCGLGVTTLGIVVVSAWGVETDRRLALGESLEVSGYEFQLDRIEDVQGPNYRAAQGVVNVSRDGRPVTTLYPQERVYEVQQNPMTEAGIDAGWRHDLFVALGQPLGEEAWSVRVQVKPLVRLIWLGALIMGLGGLLAISDRRYRVVAPKEDES